ncbi:MAG: DUF362 domain-containing protein [Nitrospirae bacterium]|nr:MAG: DUF362 domain-containing protein [Nitrospirota bacterium]
MVEVIIKHVPTYNYSEVKRAIKESIYMLGGINAFIRPGQRVLIKPNLLAASTPEQAIVTHPYVVRAVTELVIDVGAHPIIGDSPAVGSFGKILKKTGLLEALKDLNVEIKEFTNSTTVEAAHPFKKLELATDALEADVIINLPKLKTHRQMVLTVGIKNLFGCVVGMKKPQWHYRAGVNEEYFARLLVTIYQTLKPSLTIVDGILSLEGDGPGTSGIPRQLGVIMASTDALAIDITVSRMIGLEPETVPTNKAALSMLKDGKAFQREIKIEGILPTVSDFKLPDVTHLFFGPFYTHKLLRSYFITKPFSDPALCRLCGECWKYCPAQVITPREKGVAIDYNRCIRCFCCVEVCPHRAMKTKIPPAGKILKRVSDLFKIPLHNLIQSSHRR